MFNSIKMDVPCEFINITPMNPLISKCQIKVCYVGQTPNRNRSIITKEVATQMANTLPGSPIVGFYNEETGDFEEHNKEIYFEDGKIKLKDTTRPYGFVDLNAKCWFQKFLDNGVEHEYLMTEGYLWTGQYPESKRVIEKGNNQSMELDENLTDAFWTNLNNSKGKFFIINESVFSKLCILGEDYEPCFEGASISNVQFSFDESFNQRMYSMMEEMTKYIINNKGGEEMPEKDEVLEVSEELTEETQEPEVVEEAAGAEDETQEPEASDPEDVPAEEPKADPAPEETEAGEGESEFSLEEENNTVTYQLNEIPEYVELNTNYSALVIERDELLNTVQNLQAQVDELTSFKHTIERKEKEDMIKSFYMLSDEDKKDVMDNIDLYSLDEIEAKLSVICVRNKVNFSLDEKEEDNQPLVFNLDEDDTNSAVPAWVKAVLETSKDL